VADQMLKAMIKKQIQVHGARVLVLGFAFKPNCPDIRNTKVIDIIEELETFGIKVDVHDSWADSFQVTEEFDIALNHDIQIGIYDGIIIAVDHDEYRGWGMKKIRAMTKKQSVIYDIKSMFQIDESDLRL